MLPSTTFCSFRYLYAIEEHASSIWQNAKMLNNRTNSFWETNNLSILFKFRLLIDLCHCCTLSYSNRQRDHRILTHRQCRSDRTPTTSSSGLSNPIDFIVQSCEFLTRFIHFAHTFLLLLLLLCHFPHSLDQLASWVGYAAKGAITTRHAQSFARVYPFFMAHG